MDAERHALLARRLMDACGGPVAAADFCRVDRSQLSRYGQPESGQFMPADVIAALEARAGAPIYSLAIAEACVAGPAAEDVLTEAMETTEAAAELQRTARAAALDGKITPTERRRLRQKAIALREQLREFESALAGEGLGASS